MAIEIVIPEVGEGGMEITFVQWLCDEGDAVVEGDLIFEVDTDKSTLEVESFASGRISDLRVQAGDIVEPHQVVALLLQNGEESDDVAVGGTEPSEAEVRESALPQPAQSSGIESRTRERAAEAAEASPKARRIAKERGVDLTGVAGTGPDGIITAGDVEAQALGGDSADADAGTDRAERIRRAVAEVTVNSWRTVPHIHLGLDADVTDALGRTRPMTLLCAAVAGALKRRPEMNLRWDGTELIRRATVDLGILLDTPKGLLLPTVRDADRMEGDELTDVLRSLGERARTGSLRPEELGARSISISNLGMHAVDRFTGVIAHPDTLLLSAGRVRTVARWVADTWQPRQVMELQLSLDHRVFDGADGGRFLDTLERLLAAPDHIGLSPQEVAT